MNTKRSDLRVAAIANESGATVVTRNRRDSGRMSAPKIEDWTT
jgi:predicted nucleic acid-binding protein